MGLIWISALIVLLIIILAIVFIKRGKKREKLTPLSAIAFIFVISSMLFGDSRIVAYSLIGIGIIIAVIDIFLRGGNKK